MNQECFKPDITSQLSSLHESQLSYVKRIEKENVNRVLRLKNLRKNNVITGFGLAGAVFGIYLYSIFSVKQDNFLELDRNV